MSGAPTRGDRTPAFAQAERDAESMAFFENFFANTHPQSLKEWKLMDIQPDDKLFRFAASGIGLSLLRIKGNLDSTDPKSHRANDCFDETKVGGALPEGTHYCLDLKHMADYEVRKAFERYGAVAYFDQKGGLLEIRRPANAAKDFKKAPECANGHVGIVCRMTFTKVR